MRGSLSVMAGSLPSLRVLIADGSEEKLGSISAAVRNLGHEVVTETDVVKVPIVTEEYVPDVALVMVGHTGGHALELIRAIVREATCPVIAVLDVQDRGFVQEAASQGIFAYVTMGEDLEELQSSIDIVLRRFAEYHNLEGAFGRRALIERAKGVLMERHGIGDQEAFNKLRAEARSSHRKLVDVAAALLDSLKLLPNRPQDT